jgi:hypothetical protein
MFGRFMRQRRLRDRASVAAAIGLCVVAAAMSLSSQARAAGGAYVVDTSEVSAAGSCKVETWISWAGNRDSIGVANPACVVDVGRPVEFSGGFYRSRFDEEWATGMAPKAKTKIIPSAIGSFGLAITGQAAYDFTTRETTALFVNLPATMRLSDVVRINVNAGWLWDRIVDRHYLFYGLGVDWRTPNNVWTFTAEVFGQAGPEQEVATVTQSRFQSGCAGGRSTCSPSISSMAATSTARTPTGSPSPPPSASRRPAGRWEESKLANSEIGNSE